MIEKIFNRELTWRVVRKPVSKANANQLAEAGRIVWNCSNKGKSIPERFSSGDVYAKFINEKKGTQIFKKGLFSGVYKLTKEGRNWTQAQCPLYGLKEDASLWDFMVANIHFLKKG